MDTSVRSAEFYRQEQDAVKAAMDVREQIVAESNFLWESMYQVCSLFLSFIQYNSSITQLHFCMWYFLSFGSFINRYEDTKALNLYFGKWKKQKYQKDEQSFDCGWFSRF